MAATPHATPDNTLHERVLTTHELLAVVPLDRSTLWRMSQRGEFPAPIQLTSSRIGWRWSAIKQWLDEREANPPRRRAYFPRQPA